MDIGAIAGSIATVTTGDGIAKPKNAAEAAEQFEALLLAQMLRAARPEGTEEDDTTSSTMWDMAAQQFSQLLAKNGGLGLSKTIASGLNRAE